MSNVNSFIEGLSKEKLLCFFILLWGISWVIGDVNSLIYYLTSSYQGILDKLLSLLSTLVGLLAGLALTLFGFKLLTLTK
jgi:hypothetical protein